MTNKAKQTKQTNQEKAMTAFLESIGKSRELLAEIQEYVDNHMETDPDQINWGDVGSAVRLQESLTDIANFLFGREE